MFKERWPLGLIITRGLLIAFLIYAIVWSIKEKGCYYDGDSRDYYDYSIDR